VTKDAEQLAALASVIEALTDRGIDSWLFGGWAVLLRGDDGAVLIPFRAGRVTWSKEPFGDDVAELGGVRARVIPLDVLRSGKSHPRDDASDAAKDRADSETLSRVR